MLAEAERVLVLAEEEPEDDEDDPSKPTESDEIVFAQSYIPRALTQVYDPERDVEKVLRGEGGGLIYADITGVAGIHKEGGVVYEEEEEEKLEAVKEEGEGSESGSESGSWDERRPRGKKHEDKDEKKVSPVASGVLGEVY
jgi:RIO kinase 1